MSRRARPANRIEGRITSFKATDCVSPPAHISFRPSAQRALLTHVTPPLRSVSMAVDEPSRRWAIRFVFEPAEGLHDEVGLRAEERSHLGPCPRRELALLTLLSASSALKNPPAAEVMSRSTYVATSRAKVACSSRPVTSQASTQALMRRA